MTIDAPREGLVRAVSFEVRATPDGDGHTLEGYAAVFGSPTRIDSWEGQFDEVIAPGAFKKTLRERTPVLMFNHGSHPMVGSMPIGAIESAREDKAGLFIRARLSDNWLVQPVRDAIAEGSITGMSFRFSVVKDAWQERGGKQVPLRTLHEVKVPELGPVVFPAYADTSVAVREMAQHLALNDDFRAQLARAMFHGTSEGAGQEATPTEAAPVEPAESHSRGYTPAQRRAFLHPFLTQEGARS